MEYFDTYIRHEMNVLIIGSNSQVFVDRYRDKFISVWGVDYVEHPFIYCNKLQNINFPTDYFDLIVCNDFATVFQD